VWEFGNSAEFLELFHAFLATFWDGSEAGKASIETRRSQSLCGWLLFLWSLETEN